MGKPLPGDVFGNALGNIGILLDLFPIIIEFVVINYINPILDK